MNVPLWIWVALVAGTIVIIAIDLLVISKPDREMRVRTAIIWTTFWLAAGVAFGFLIAAGWGSRYAGEYWSGFLLEYSLSMDNVFVFIVLFGFFATPAAARLRVLTVGILLALALRLVAILVGGVLITRASWVLYLFGAFLLWTAWRLISHAGDPADPEHSKVLKFLKRHLPLTGTYEGARYTVSKGGKRMITTLGLVLIMLAGTDLVFALDSIPAAFGVTKEPFIVFAVNAFALMGLRSLYFVLEGMVERFEYLSYGLAVVLAFVGVKMLVKDVWHPAAWMSLAFIAVVLASSIAISLWSTRPGRNLPSG
jgi:tellurite resistance protein TerC